MNIRLVWKRLVFSTVAAAFLLFPNKEDLKADEKTLQIGWIGPLTGPAAVLGVDTIPSMEIGFQDYQWKGEGEKPNIQLVVQDDQYETAKALSAYNYLVKGKNIKVIVMLTYGGIFAVAAQAERDGVLIIDPLDCDEKIAALPSSVICIAKATEQLGEVIAEGAVANGNVPAALLYFGSDPFMGTLAESSISYLKKHGVEVTLAESYLGGSTDFRSSLTKVRASGARSLFFYGYDEQAEAMKQAKALGITAQFYAANTITSPSFQKNVGEASKGAFVGTYQAQRTPRFAEYLDKFRKRTGEAPSFEVSAVPSYDVAQLLMKGIEQENTVDPAGIKKFLLATRNYPGLSGEISIDSDGATRSIKSRLFKWDGQKLDVVDAPGSK